MNEQLINELLQQLTNAVGVSGEEKEVRILIRDLIAEHVDDWHVDNMGNLIACKKGTGEQNLRVMVDAHMDEVGLIVTGFASDGTIKFNKIGGIDDRTLLGKAVQVGPKKIWGVIGAKPIHLTSASERATIVSHSNMRIDIGAPSKDAAQGKLSVGDRATFFSQYAEWNGGQTAVAKALDDRAACAILIELLRADPYPFDLYASFSVQEEVGLRGAGPATYGINPDVAFAIEVTPAYDLPQRKEEDESSNVTLGDGAVIYVMDRGTIQDPRLVSYLTQTAVAHNIRYQIRQPGGGGTNTAAIQRTRAGISAATIAIPGRYLHAPHSMINLSDYAQARQLTETALRNLTAEVIKR